MTRKTLQLGPFEKARFIERPNRFLIRCETERSGPVDAFLPNPGRLRELLLPNVPLYVTQASGSDERKTTHTVLAVERDGAPIFLHTHHTNKVARFLIEHQRIPGLEAARIVRSEIPRGHSRFDFLLRQGEQDVYLEVKSCTLFGNGVAMFPDAITERGRRHLLELAELRRRRVQAAALFVVHTPRVRWFMPDYHTDPAFSEVLLRVRRKIQVLPISIQWTSQLSLGPRVKRLEVPWDYVRREAKDRGSYLVILRLNCVKRIDVGQLGRMSFRPGYYVYVGSAMRSLSARIARHMRLRKKRRWHIDYLRQAADACTALPIRSSTRDECHIAWSLQNTLLPGPPRFGASDCHCSTHLFWHATDPLDSVAFHSLVHRFRMRAPTKGIDFARETSQFG